MTTIDIEIQEQPSDRPLIQVIGEVKIDCSLLSELTEQMTEAERYNLAVDLLRQMTPEEGKEALYEAEWVLNVNT